MNQFPRMASFLDNTDLINGLLNQLADEGTIEPMVEPIDEPDCDPFDYAEVTGLFDEMYPCDEWYF